MKEAIIYLAGLAAGGIIGWHFAWIRGWRSGLDRASEIWTHSNDEALARMFVSIGITRKDVEKAIGENHAKMKSFVAGAKS